MTNQIKFESVTFGKRLKSMFNVDFRRMFTMPLFYIMVGVAFVIPVLVLVMTSMMSGTTVDPTTGVETTIQGFTNVWQSISSISGGSAMSMDLTSMCNINLLYFLIAVFVCIFVADDFRSGYAKNLFAVRAKKSDYVISKTAAAFVCGTAMILAYLAGAMIGGAIAGLSFDMGSATGWSITMCMLSKISLMLVFVAIYLIASVFAKQKLWLSLVISFGSSMLLFAMIPMLTPLDATILNVLLCLVGGAMFATGLGYASKVILDKTSLV